MLSLVKTALFLNSIFLYSSIFVCLFHQMVYFRFFLLLEVGLHGYEFPSWDCFCCAPQVLGLGFLFLVVCLVLLLNC